jgi:hypothetical protein
MSWPTFEAFISSLEERIAPAAVHGLAAGFYRQDASL